MELFNENGISTPKGIVATTPEEAEAAYKEMGNRK
jgi:succinyl-CoA synthetase beta subunit